MFLRRPIKGATLDFGDLQSAKGFGAIARELARRLRGTRVTANCLHPGFVATGSDPPEDRKVLQLGKGDYGVMQTVETGDWTNPRLCQSIKLANVNGIQSADIIRASGHRSRA
jgi:NAD(P)-dependent dehydrogenase (short-subunit alcohol dehydrogenase family)